jgi:hypothetical protein
VVFCLLVSVVCLLACVFVCLFVCLYVVCLECERRFERKVVLRIENS